MKNGLLNPGEALVVFRVKSEICIGNILCSFHLQQKNKSHSFLLEKKIFLFEKSMHRSYLYESSSIDFCLEKLISFET